MQTPEFKSAGTSEITSTSSLYHWNTESFFKLATWRGSDMQEDTIYHQSVFNLIYNLLWLNHSHSTCLANKSDRGIITNLNGEELHKVRAWKNKNEKMYILKSWETQIISEQLYWKTSTKTSLSGLLVLVGLSLAKMVVIWFSWEVKIWDSKSTSLRGIYYIIQYKTGILLKISSCMFYGSKSYRFGKNMREMKGLFNFRMNYSCKHFFFIREPIRDFYI